MRFLTLAFCASLFLAAPAMAQQSAPTNSSGNSGHVFGRAFCSTAIPCTDGKSLNVSFDYVAAGNACVHEQFGYGNIDEFFKSYSGLDSNNCLTPKSHVLGSNGTNVELSPQCCVTHKTEEVCIFRCTLVSM